MSGTASKYAVGYGSTVSVATIATDGTIGTYTEVGQTKDIKGPDSEVGEINVTNNESPDNTKEYAPGMIEPGVIGWDMVYRDDQYTSLYAKFGDGNKYSWKETFVDGSTIIVPGFLRKAPITTKTEDGANMVSVEVKCTGKPVFAAGS